MTLSMSMVYRSSTAVGLEIECKEWQQWKRKEKMLQWEEGLVTWTHVRSIYDKTGGGEPAEPTAKAGSTTLP